MPNTATLLATGCAFGILACLTRRPIMALLLCLYLLAAILISSAVMQSYLGMPLTLADVQFFFRDPIDDLELFVNYPALGCSFVGVIAGAVLLLVFGYRRERWRVTLPLWLQVLRFALAAVLVGVLCWGYEAAPPMAHTGTVDDRDAWSAFLALRRLELADHWMERLNVFFDNRDMLATLPPAHAQTRFPQPPDDFPAPDAVAHLPDVLMVLEESTFDPKLVARCTFPACDSPMFQAPAGALRTLQGPFLVHTTGGGTWLTEFGFLSGFDWRTFGRGGAYAPISLAPRLHRSLPQYLRTLGYHTVVVSAVGADFLRARSAYGYYGFDEFYASQDLKLSSDWHAVHDGQVFDKALAIVNASKDPRPVFVFILTIRNHGPHGDTRGALPARVTAVEKSLGRPMADYLARLDDSAREIDALRRSWLASPRPRVLGWFGDHEPEFAWDFFDRMSDINPSRLATNVGEAQLKYLTYHQLSANFGTPGVTTSTEALDVPFLPTELLEFAGIPLDAGARATSFVAARCHKLLLDCADRELVSDYLTYRIHDLQSVR